MKGQEGNSHTVWLLGAGASVPGGLPVMNNYMATVRYCYAHDLKSHPDEKTRFKEALEYVQDKIQAGVLEEHVKDDMEAIFSLLDTEAELAGDKRAKSVRPHLTFTSMRTSQLCHDHGPAEDRLRQRYSREKAREFYDRFVSKSTTGRCAIITFNQDLLVDAALLRSGLKPEYHLPGDTENIHSKPEGSGRDLLKLHGSGNWYHCPDHKRRLVH